MEKIPFDDIEALEASSARDEEYLIAGAGNVANYGSDKLRFLSPVPAGAKVPRSSRPRPIASTTTTGSRTSG